MYVSPNFKTKKELELVVEANQLIEKTMNDLHGRPDDTRTVEEVLLHTALTEEKTLKPFSKQVLAQAIKQRGRVRDVTVFAPGLGTSKTNGNEYVEGPHYPAPHTWYATVTMVNGKIVRVH